MSEPITLDEARKIISGGEGTSSYARQAEAAAVIAKFSTDYGDLIRCLRLGGLPAETAAIALYSRTARHLGGDISDFSADAEDWTEYLALRNESPRTFLQTNRWGVAA